MILHFYKQCVKIKVLNNLNCFTSQNFVSQHQELNHSQKKNVPFTLYFDYDKTELHTFQPYVPSQDTNQVYEHFLRNFLFKLPMLQILHMRNSNKKAQM